MRKWMWALVLAAAVATAGHAQIFRQLPGNGRLGVLTGQQQSYPLLQIDDQVVQARPGRAHLRREQPHHRARLSSAQRDRVVRGGYERRHLARLYPARRRDRADPATSAVVPIGRSRTRDAQALHQDLRLPDERVRLGQDGRRAAAADGIEPTDDPEEADVILFNTCSVREKAQEKVFHDLGRVQAPEARESRPA